MQEVSGVVDSLVLALRIGLAVLFGVAGALKLLDSRGARRTLVEFGVWEVVASPLAVVLPMVELCVAVLLVVSATARLAAFAALVLLIGFSVAIGTTLRRGRRPPCNCFGHLSSAPVSSWTLVRNAGLAGLAISVIWFGPGADVPALGSMVAGWPPDGLTLVLVVILFAAVALETWLLLHVLRQQGRLLVRLEALESATASQQPSERDIPLVGARAPDFRLPDLTGSVHSLSDLLLRGRDLLLVFMDTHCPTCRQLVPELIAWEIEQPEALSIVCISVGDREPARTFFLPLRLRTVLVDEQGAVAGTYAIAGTPTAILVNAAGVVSSPFAEGIDAVRDLLQRALHHRPRATVDALA